LILRIFLSKLKRLLKIQSEIKSTNNIEEVMTNYKPPIFWKEKEIVKQQIKIWSYEEIQKLLIKIYNIEMLAKKNPSISMNIVTDFILEQAA
jgi:DNA polymerase-3 subunit delta